MLYLMRWNLLVKLKLRRVIEMTIDEAIAKHRKIAETQKALYDACTLKEHQKKIIMNIARTVERR